MTDVPAELPLESCPCTCVAEETACNGANDSPGITPLQLACRYVHFSVVKFLLERGAVVNAVTVNHLHTPLQIS